MADLNFQLLPWQQEVFSDKTRFKVVAAGRRCGKSRMAAVTLLIEGLRCPQGSAVLYVSPTMGQSRQIVWDLLLDLGRDIITNSHVNNLDITLINGARIYVRGADRPDTLRGVSLTYAVLDEVADIKPEAWEQVIRASLSDKKGRALFIGTPKGRNWFYDTFKLGENGDDTDWKSWHFTTQDNPLIDPTEIESAKKTLSTFAFKQEYMASFSNAGSDIFKEDWIKYGVEPEHGSYFISIDLAGFEEVAKQAGNAKKRLDESAICVVKATEDGKWFVKEIIHGRWDIRETASKILMAIRDYRPTSVGIERGALKNAVLPYLSDLMRKNNVYAHIVDLTHGNRKKTDRVIWALQGRFEHGRIILNSEENWDDFIDQLLMFPATGVHDDLPDALSYMDQLAVTSYFEQEEDDFWEPLDIISGV
jgi:predicted phage terminase large subunit-like protein